MITTPRLLYAGDKEKALSLKGAGLAWWYFVSDSNPDVNFVTRTKKLQDGSLLIAEVQSLGYGVKTGIVRIITENVGGSLALSGFLYKERDDSGSLTGKINWIVTDKNGFVEVRKDVDLFSELEVWSNHAGDNSLLTAQRYFEGKEVIPPHTDEDVLYSWVCFGKLLYLCQTKEPVLFDGDGLYRRILTVRIKGSTQTFVIPNQTIEVVSVGANSSGNSFFVFCRMPDADFLVDLITGPNYVADNVVTIPVDLTGYHYDKAVTDKNEILRVYNISKGMGGELVFTFSGGSVQFQAWAFKEQLASGNVTIDAVYTPDILLYPYYDGNTLKASWAKFTGINYNNSTNSFGFNFKINDIDCHIYQDVEVDHGSSTADWYIHRVNYQQRYAKLNPYAITSAIDDPTPPVIPFVSSVRLLKTIAHDDIGACDLSSLNFIAQYARPLNFSSSVAGSATHFILDQVFQSVRNIVSASRVPARIDPFSSVDFHNDAFFYDVTAFYSNTTDTIDSAIFILCPRFCFAQGQYGLGGALTFSESITAYNSKNYSFLNNDFASILTDKFENYLVISYGSDYQLGKYQDYAVDPIHINNPTITVKVITKTSVASAIRLSAVVTDNDMIAPVTQLLKRDDIVGVI